jgi:hypothetical protein
MSAMREEVDPAKHEQREQEPAAGEKVSPAIA